MGAMEAATVSPCFSFYEELMFFAQRPLQQYTVVVTTLFLLRLAGSKKSLVVVGHVERVAGR